MNTKHTPGPWKVYQERFVEGADKSPVVNMGHPDNEQAKANAALIASAPDLLSALEDVELRATQARLASTIGKKAGQADFLRGELDRIGQAARAAITKAQEMKTP